MGLDGTSGVMGADNYSTYGRDINLDGHWVTVTATITHAVPEVGSMAMSAAGAGLAFLGFFVRRRRQSAKAAC